MQFCIHDKPRHDLYGPLRHTAGFLSDYKCPAALPFRTVSGKYLEHLAQVGQELVQAIRF